MNPPIIIPNCCDELLLDEAIEEMFEIVMSNGEAGYAAQHDILYETIEAGLTISTFNMLAKNLNIAFQEQWAKGKNTPNRHTHTVH